MPKKKRPARPEDALAYRRIRDPRISPDGTLVAYVQSEVLPKQDRETESIWLVRLDGRGAPRRFTSADHHSHSPRWSPDGQRLAFVSARDKKSQLYVAPLHGGEPERLTDAPDGPGDPAWSPDGRRIAFVRTVRPERKDNPAAKNAPRVITDLYFKLDGVGMFDERRRHLFVIDVASGEETPLTTGDWHDTQPAWSPDGKSIAFVSDRSRRRFDQGFRGDVWVVPSRGGKAVRRTRERGGAASPAFSPDGKWIAFVGHEYGDAMPGRSQQLMLVAARGRGTPRVATEGFDSSVIPGSPNGPVLTWTPDGKHVLFLGTERGTVPVFQTEVASGITKAVVDGELQAQNLALAPDGKTVVYGAIWLSTLPELRATPLGRGRSRTLVKPNAELERSVTLGATRRLQYKSEDGLALEAFVLYPPGYQKTRRYPLVLDVHGGPHGAHPATFSLLQLQSVAAAGYVVLLPNPRGSTGYGEAFESGCLGDWGGGDYRDLMQAVDVAIERKIADPERLYVMGYSYGGYMTSWIVGHTKRFCAAVIGAPITDLLSGLGTDDIPRYNVESMGGSPKTNYALYRERSPISNVEKVRTPCLIAHWEGDLRCPIGQSEQFFVGLKLAGQKPEFVRYPGGSHVGRTPSQDVDYNERVLAWFAKHSKRARS